MLLRLFNLVWFAAHEWRWTEKATLSEVTLEQIWNLVQQFRLSLKVSCASVHCLMLPQHKGRQLSKLYKGLISVIVPSKQKSCVWSDHEYDHYTMAQITYCNKLFELYSNEGVRLSAGDKIKINVDSLAESHYFQIRQFFPPLILLTLWTMTFLMLAPRSHLVAM